MGFSVEVVRKPPKPVPEEVARIWAAEWSKEGKKKKKKKKKVDWERLMPQRGFRVLPTADCVDIDPHAMHVRVIE
jgi:hypothetical protein